MTGTASGERRRQQVFLSYASEDNAVAGRVAQALKDSGSSVWLDNWELAAGDSIVDRVEAAMAATDLLIVLLSPRSVPSKWVQEELNRRLWPELRDRAITV